MADAPTPPTPSRPAPNRPPPNRLRLIAAGVFATPLLALPLYAAVKNMAGRHAIPAAYRATPVPQPKPKPALVEASAPVAATSPAPADGPFVVKRILDTGGPIPYGDYFWDESGVPAGPLVITVDLAAETISAFRDGYEIGAAAVIYGDVGKETPLGVFPITQKDADHVSNLYNAPMPYMLRLTNDGVSIHGSKVEWDYATHGCIGVPIGFAKRLFAVAKIGDRVIVTRGKTLDMGQRIIAPKT